jgi:peptide/nickel transport system substrate-binding protein
MKTGWNHIAGLARSRRLNRREFIQQSVAAGMTVGAAEALFIKSARAEAKKGGTFRVGLGGASTTDTLDPATYISTTTQIAYSSGIHNQLVEFMPDGTVKPELAESIEASPDAKTWTFKLRPGVEFHNGKTLTAEDVIASINHHRGEDSKSAMKPLLAPITDIRADGPQTVVVTLEAGNADFPFLMNDYHMPIMPAKDGKADWQSGVGAGAYKLMKNDPGVRIELARNSNYYKPDRGWFDECVVLGIADVAARQAALQAGDVDAINDVDRKTAAQFAKVSGVVIDEVTGTQHYTIPMDVRAAPFNNLDVRLALKYAIDREAMVNTILFGRGRVANDHPIAPVNRYFAAGLEQHMYDPDKARFHLGKAGLSELKVDLSAANTAFDGAVDAAVLYAAQAGKAGITINVVREPDDGYWDNVWMKRPFCMSYWGGRATEDWMFTTAYAAGGAWNETYWGNDRFMQLLLAARAELDDAKRREMYYEMQSIVRDDGGSIIPMYANYVFARSDKVAHSGQLSSNWSMDGLKALERWWFV